ncbi:hypothetical protein QAD02_014465 [Eretmocerus hayati]|uniref:Uncharacterized protein n=1 Tax=Eretmocerus hayati TaxID=131215 RepID=A0ACC2P6E8_9HYME|nr:hypothetical protein QAD02_014465 [Eretmocerus hayati]
MSTTNTNSKPTEIKREEFRKYLEHAGVMDALTNVLLSLYAEQERPDDALEYMRKYFAAMNINRTDSSCEVETLKRELYEARLQVAELKEKLGKYESAVKSESEA